MKISYLSELLVLMVEPDREALFFFLLNQLGLCMMRNLGRL